MPTRRQKSVWKQSGNALHNKNTGGMCDMNIWEIIAGAAMLLWLTAGVLTIRAARKWGDVADVLLEEWEDGNED